MTRFRHLPVGFQLLLPDSGDEGRNPVSIAGIWVGQIQAKWPESGHSCWILAKEARI